MKKIFSYLLIAATFVGIMSCNKNSVAPVVNGEDEAGSCSIVVNIGTVDETKATIANMKDYRINQVQVFVFDSNNRLETSVFKAGLSAETSTSLTMNTKTGTKTVYALVNHDRLYFTPGSTGKTLAQFEAEVTDLGQCKSETWLTMSGKNTIDVVDINNMGAPGSAQNVNVFVKRLPAKIQLNGVKVDFRNTDLENATFSISRIYLKNVVGKSPIGVSALTGTASATARVNALPDSYYTTDSNWYNKMREEGTVPGVIYESMTETCNVAGTVTDLNRVLFTFPNETTGDVNSTTFSRRHTRIVIKAHVTKNADGVDIDKDTFYVLDLPILLPNYEYIIQNVNITQLGKDDDNDDSAIKAGKITPVITVDPWTDQIDLNYEF